MNIVTGYRATPHITSSQDRGANQGAYGRNSYILDVGEQLAAEIVSANEVRIRDGVLSHQGCVASIDQGAYDSLTISNGSQGLLRTDLIVARYSKDTETNVESMELVVIEGEAVASDPVAPAYNEGDIQAGDSPVDMPLYHVNINGVSLESVTQVATSLSNIEELQTAVSELNSNRYISVSGEVNARKIGNVVTLMITCTSKSVTTRAWNNIATLPESIRPQDTLRFIGYDNSKSNPADIPMPFDLDANGLLRFYVNTTGSYTPYATISYVTKSF